MGTEVLGAGLQTWGDPSVRAWFVVVVRLYVVGGFVSDVEKFAGIVARHVRIIVNPLFRVSLTLTTVPTVYERYFSLVFITLLLVVLGGSGRKSCCVVRDQVVHHFYLC